MDRVIVGDARDLLRELPACISHCAVTSPPYFGHRCYSTDPREIGREDQLDQYIAHMVEVLACLRRVLRDDGTLWLNLGDTYRNGRLLGVPWRVAMALQESGWLLRADIIWHKPNAMPSSVRKRPTVDHEYIFLFSKTNEYYYDADAIREPHVTFSEQSRMRGGRGHFGKRNGTPETGKNGGNPNLHTARWDQAFHPLGRNKRTVWSVPLGKCRETHFAVFPQELIAPCIKAGCPHGGLVIDPFTGSGTTGIVSRQLNRHFLGLELVPQYAEMARKRIDATKPAISLFDATKVHVLPPALRVASTHAASENAAADARLF